MKRKSFRMLEARRGCKEGICERKCETIAKKQIPVIEGNLRVWYNNKASLITFFLLLKIPS